MERAATWCLRAAEADLERALERNAELGDRVHQMGAEGQTWQGIANGHEAIAAGLRRDGSSDGAGGARAPPNALDSMEPHYILP
uniref:Uncharacterized protein n=1 Tax=Zea mays TaxID=4577 RepID=A0A804PIC0_MAIZE